MDHRDTRSTPGTLEDLIVTKLTPPDLPPLHVARPDRRKLIADGVQVTSVLAPAGFGKTVLAREWVEEEASVGAVAWYTVDALDGDPSVFWRHVIAAIDAVAPLGPEPAALVAERGSSDPTFLHSLLRAVLERGEDVTLVLDDLHLLTDRTALDQLALLVDRSGGALRLVFTARTPPGLPLARWRLERRLHECTEDDLRFGRRDAEQLLEGLQCPPLAEDALADLVDRTEGWVAGLQLAALAAPDDPRRAVVDHQASGRAIAGYLLEEVVDRLPEAQREVALDLAVLDEFDEALAAGLVARPDVSGPIHELLQSHLLLSRIGGPRPTYRFHQLLRELLREQLRVTDHERWTTLHRRAAELLRDRGNVDGAFACLIRSGDLDGAIELVVRRGLALSDQGWSWHFRQWMRRLPVDLSVEDPALMLDLAFAQFTAGDLQDADRWTDRAAEVLGEDDLRVALRRLSVSIAAGDVERVAAVLDQLDGRDLSAAAVGDEFQLRVDTTVARAHLLLGDHAATRRALDRVVAGRADDHARLVAAPAIRARLLVAEGEVNEAQVLVDAALASAAELRTANNPAMLEVMLAATAVALAGGRIAEAERYHEDLLEVVEVVDFPYSRAYAAALSIELSARQRGWPATAGLVDELCRQVGWTPEDGFTAVVDAPRARALLAAGRLDDAEPLITSMQPGRAATLLSAALLLARRRVDDALAVLGSRTDWPLADEVEAQVLRALALTGTAAEAELGRALELALPHGLVAPFLDRGEELERLLRRIPEARRLRPEPAATEPATTRRAPVEALTNRERDVLALLPTHLSNAAIGRQLYVSVNTVKTNLRTLYRKLGTSSRAETVEAARSLGLLPPEGAAG
jgi:LuxR family maltose regulon positive regulatory protein